MISRDYFFEFAGMPKAGKTTTRDIITHYLKREGFIVEEYNGGGRYAPVGVSAIGSLNMFLAASAVQFIIVALEREKVRSRVYFLDRGIFDRQIFTRALLHLNKIDSTEFDAVLSFLTVPRIVQRIDGTFLFITDPELSMQRENENKLSSKEGLVMNSGFLQTLREASLEMYELRRGADPHLHLVDTERLDGQIKESAQRVLDIILKRFSM